MTGNQSGDKGTKVDVTDLLLKGLEEIKKYQQQHSKGVTEIFVLHMGVMGGTFCVTDIDTCSVLTFAGTHSCRCRGRHTDGIDLHQKVTIQMCFTPDRGNLTLHNAHHTGPECPGNISVNVQLITSAFA